MKQIIFAISIGLLGYTCLGQGNPLVYGGAAYYRDKSFVENAYLNLNLGIQLFRWKFIAPEVGYEHHFGTVRDNKELHPDEPNAMPPSKLRTKFLSHTFSAAPKVFIGNEEAAFVFIPQYNLGKITGKGQLLEDAGQHYYLSDQRRVTNFISFWSFAAGIEGRFYESEILHFSLLLKYHLLNTEDSLEQLEFENSNLRSFGGSKNGLGITFRVYYDFLALLVKPEVDEPQ